LAGQLSGWKQKIVAFAGALGAPGLFLISFLDSSVLTFPVINDLLLIELSIQKPSRMPLYAASAMIGSVLGCVLLYYIARKGGEAFFHKKAGKRSHAIKQWVKKNGFGGMLAAAALPPPVPFKIFVFAGAVFEVPLGSFVTAIALARSLRYFGFGYLAVRYGEQAMPFMAQHKIQVLIGILVFVGICYGLSRLVLKDKNEESGDSADVAR
jgi:membrane protein YqaA with SNARE-associated domain